jgi:hypothetical protein
MSLMDVLVPPPNRWLMSLSRRRANLPPGVQIVRFNEEDDDPAANDDGEIAAKQTSGRKTG